jgi:hypothetical protein
MFYVSRSVKVKRARIHLGSCIHCRNGQGHTNGAEDDSGLTGWSSPFATLAEAGAYMEREFPTFTDKGKCFACKPGGPQ